ncbi:MAG: glycosyltransferase [Nanoarchaeota archaeon]|nr:glycosyltransferase [Nanoarchaeota archaeon]MBU4086190.1 glycosyltransferase [Nanoarchaeota archaeon]
MIREFLIYFGAFVGLFGVIFYFLGLIGKKPRKEEEIKDFELPSVSIIIPAYNEEKGIAETIKSALNQDYPREKLRVIVVDDGSKDKTYSIAKRFESKIVSVYTKKNGGKGAALNFGISKSGSEIIVTMDADTIAEMRALKKMMPYFKRKDVMCVTPAMAIHNPRGFWARIQQIEYLLGIFLRKAFASMDAIHITPGAFSAYRKVFFDKYGGYDTSTITEDMEIALRIQYHNYAIENSLDSVVYTVPPKTFRSMLNQRKRWYNGMILNLWRYRGLFSHKYGDMGVVVLPMAVITILMSIMLTVQVFVQTLSNVWREFWLFSGINFDFSNFVQINKYVVERFFFSIFSNPLFVMSLLFVLILLGYMFFAKKSVKKNAAVKFSLFLFLGFYSFLFSFWWIVSIIDTLLRRKVGWGKD